MGDPRDDAAMMTKWDPWNPQAAVYQLDERGNPVALPRDPAGLDATAWLKLRPRHHQDWGPLLEPNVLAPAELFDSQRGRREPPASSSALRVRLARLSAGRPRRITEADFQAALDADRPEAVHSEILFAWLLETTVEEIDDAVKDGAFTMRRLARALHTQELEHGPSIQTINTWAHRCYAETPETRS